MDFEFDLTFADFMAGLFSDPEMAGAHVPTPSLPAVSVAEWQQNLALPTPLEPPSTSAAFQGYPAPPGTFNSSMHLNTDMMDLFHPMSTYQSYEPAMSTFSATFPSTYQFSSDAFNLQATEQASALSGVPLMFDYTPATNFYQPAPHFTSSTPSNGTTNSSDTQTSSSSSKSKRPHRPEYVPRISRTEYSLRHGVLCAIVFECKWKDCETIICLEGSSMADETAFQKRVHGHLDEHARSASKTHGQLECQWCKNSLSPSGCKRKTMMRHLLKETAAWYFFCPKVDCDYTSSRKVANHACRARSG